MTKDDVAERFSALSEAEQVAVLSQLMADVTLEARATYVAGSDNVADPPRLRSFNELQHRVSGQLLKLVHHDSKRYADDVFIGMVWEGGEECRCLRSLIRSFEKSIQLCAH